MNNLLIICIIFIIIILSLYISLYNNYNGIHKESITLKESFESNDDYYKQIFAPLVYDYGYSNIDEPIFSAHPVKLIGSNLPDKLIKHYRINHAGGPMYWSYYPPTDEIFEKIDCPSSIVDLTNKNHPNSRYNLVCWTLAKWTK